MNVLPVKINSKDVSKVLKNTVNFSYGFLDGVEIQKIIFNEKLGEYTVNILNKYIDSQAKINPESLHHIYEWNNVGNKNYRLFKITSSASKNNILFTGSFLPSKTSINGNQPFVNKAEIMENAIAITVEPKNSNVLVFEDEGDTIFTANSVYIAHPGGDAVAGSFAAIIESFFSNYFKNAFLQPLINDLMTVKEFSELFPQGAKGGGRDVGIAAGKKYLDIKSLGVIE